MQPPDFGLGMATTYLTGHKLTKPEHSRNRDLFNEWLDITFCYHLIHFN